jgi:uncharacterized 2Fe-2S/4Fe-4S cluster protein (DUF4445 family)
MRRVEENRFVPVNIMFLPSRRCVSVGVGTRLLEAIQGASLPFPTECGGKGKCGKCGVSCDKGLAPALAREEAALREHGLGSDIRLACMATVVGNATVVLESRDGHSGDKGANPSQSPLDVDPRFGVLRANVPAASSEKPTSLVRRILEVAAAAGETSMTVDIDLVRSLPYGLSHGEVRLVIGAGHLLAVEEDADKRVRSLYGLAVDVGTTTIVMYLMDLTSGSCVDTQSAENPQTSFGADVLSRISTARHDETKFHELRAVLITSVNGLLDALLGRTGISRDDIWDAVVVGNTTMMHFFLGLSPGSLAVIPYNSVTDEAVESTATNVGLRIARGGRVRTLPGCASFVGADTVAAVVASGMQESPGDRLLIDIGTNGEIVLGNSERLITCSAAAGPAFEGANIQSGVRAVAGAIDRVRVEDDLIVGTIADAEAIGICGSGVIDAVYACRSAGLIGRNGNIVRTHSNPRLARRVVEWGRGRAIILTRDHGTDPQILLTQEDVRQVQLAKGAIRAGVELLLEEKGLNARDIQEVILAGAFGSYVRPESAVGIGLIPALSVCRVQAIGNAAGRGAQMTLLSKAVYEESLALSKAMEYVPLSAQPNFHRRFLEGMTFPDLPCRLPTSAGS